MRFGLFIFYRLIAIIGQILGSIALVLILVDIVPYDITYTYIFSYTGTNPKERDAAVKSLKNELGLDQSLFDQYKNYIVRMIKEHSLGSSWTNGEAVTDLLTEALKYSFITFGLAFIIYTPIAIILGILSSKYRRSKLDTISRIITTTSYSIPPFILGIWLIVTALKNNYKYALWPTDPPEDIITLLKYDILPIITVILIYTSFQFRLIRNHFINILQQDYIRTARAKGLDERTVLMKHALRNALPFFITTVAVTFPIAFSGIAVIEIVFGIPGAGNLLVNHALAFDWPVLIGGTVIYTVINAIILMITDLLIYFVSPKLRLSEYSKNRF